MSTYQFADRGKAIAFGPNGYAPFRKNLNVPDLISYGGLQDTSGNAASLATTGFASSDILRVFEVPAGFALTMAGVRVTTAEGSTCTGDIGCNSATQTHLLAVDANGIMDTLNLNSATTQINLIGDAQLGGSTYNALVFITDGTVDLTFNNACASVIADLWLNGQQCW
jgi:hypothetical protein